MVTWKATTGARTLGLADPFGWLQSEIMTEGPGGLSLLYYYKTRLDVIVCLVICPVVLVHKRNCGAVMGRRLVNPCDPSRSSSTHLVFSVQRPGANVEYALGFWCIIMFLPPDF